MPENAVKNSIYSPLQEGKFNPEKPYNICVSCVYRETKRCDGPNYLALEGPRRCELFQDRLAYLKQTEPGKWTYKYIANLTGTSEATIIRIFTDPDYDPRVSTFAAFVREVMGGSWGEFPCAMLSSQAPELKEVESPELLKQLAEKDVQIANLRRNYDELRSSVDKEFALIRSEKDSDVAEYRELNNYLKDQVKLKDGYVADLWQINKILQAEIKDLQAEIRILRGDNA